MNWVMLFTCKDHYEQYWDLWYTLNISRYTNFWEISSTRDCEWKNNIEQNSWDWSAFIMIFLRATHAGTAVLQMLFWTSDISFHIDLGLWTMNKKRLFLIGEMTFELKLTAPAKLRQPCPDFQKKSQAYPMSPMRLWPYTLRQRPLDISRNSHPVEYFLVTPDFDSFFLWNLICRNYQTISWSLLYSWECYCKGYWSGMENFLLNKWIKFFSVCELLITRKMTFYILVNLNLIYSPTY